jgi:hypothetical protein
MLQSEADRLDTLNVLFKMFDLPFFVKIHPSSSKYTPLFAIDCYDEIGVISTRILSYTLSDIERRSQKLIAAGQRRSDKYDYLPFPSDE